MEFVVLDDRDTSIAYSTGWAQAGSANEFDSTTTWTGVRGATANVTFSGTSIGVYGTIVQKGLLSQEPASSSYTVDGNASVVFTGTPQATTQYKQLFFQSATLPAGTHTLMITNQAANDNFFLDFFEVVPANTSSSNSSASSSSTSSSSSSSSSSSFEITSTTSGGIKPTVPATITITKGVSSSGTAESASSQTAKPLSTASKGVNSGAVVGGVFGGVVLLALFVVAFVYVRQQRRRAEMDLALSGSNFWEPQPSHEKLTEPVKLPPRSYPSYPSMSPPQSESAHYTSYQAASDSHYQGPQSPYQSTQSHYQTTQSQYQNPQSQYQNSHSQYQSPQSQYPTAQSRYQSAQSQYRPSTYAQSQYAGPADYGASHSPTELPYHSGGDFPSPGAGGNNQQGSNRYLPPSHVITNGGQN